MPFSVLSFTLTALQKSDSVAGWFQLIFFPHVFFFFYFFFSISSNKRITTQFSVRRMTRVDISFFSLLRSTFHACISLCSIYLFVYSLLRLRASVWRSRAIYLMKEVEALTGSHSHVSRQQAFL